MAIKVFLSVAVCLVLLVNKGRGMPAPQQEEEEEYLDDDVYGDYDKNDESPSPPPLDLGQLLGQGAGLAQGLFGILGDKVNFIKGLLADKDLQRSIHQAIGVGLNLTGQVASVALPVVLDAAAQVPNILEAKRQALSRAAGIVTSPEIQERLGGVVGAGSNVVRSLGQATRQVPNLAGQGGRLVGSFISAANETAPLIIEGIREFTDQLPLIAGFASAYAEVNAEQAQKVTQAFASSLQCNLSCGDIENSQEKATCEKKHNCAAKDGEEER